MEKFLFFLIFYFVSLNSILSQVAYLDACELARHENSKGDLKSDDQVVISILSRYLPDTCKFTGKETFERIFNGNINPFIRVSKRTKQTTVTSFVICTEGSPQGEIIRISDRRTSDLLPVMSDDELAGNFFKTLKSSFESNELMEKMLPVTYRFITGIESNSIPLIMSVLKEGFITDLNNLLTNLPVALSDQQYRQIISKYPDTESESEISSFAAIYIPMIILGTHPACLIKDFSKQSEIKAFSRNLNNSLDMISLISESLRDTLSNKAWISLRTFNDDYLKNPEIFRIYEGLLFMKGNNIIFKIRSQDKNSRLQTLQGYLRENKDKSIKLFSYFYNFLKISNNIDNALKDIREVNSSEENLPVMRYYNYLHSSVSLLEYGLNYLNLFSPGSEANDSLVLSFIDITKRGCNVFKYLTDNNYSAAIMDLFYILNYAADYNKIESHLISDAKIQDIDPKTKEDAGLDIAVIKNDMLDKEELLKYLVFASYLVESHSNNEVLSAIGSIVSPAGKSINNGQKVFSVSLNAFAGVFCGNENFSGNYINIAGVFAPIGFAVKQGISKNNGQYLGIFISLVNPGELTSFYLQNSNYADLPELRLENIFAPGGFIIYGLPGIPVSLGIGASYGPAYRSAVSQVARSVPFNYSISAFLAVDLNLKTFYSKQKNARKKKAGKSLL